jgi:hypothetical protein
VWPRLIHGSAPGKQSFLSARFREGATRRHHPIFLLSSLSLFFLPVRRFLMKEKDKDKEERRKNFQTAGIASGCVTSAFLPCLFA